MYNWILNLFCIIISGHPFSVSVTYIMFYLYVECKFWLIYFLKISVLFQGLQVRRLSIKGDQWHFWRFWDNTNLRQCKTKVKGRSSIACHVIWKVIFEKQLFFHIFKPLNIILWTEKQFRSYNFIVQCLWVLCLALWGINISTWNPMDHVISVWKGLAIRTFWKLYNHLIRLLNYDTL